MRTISFYSYKGGVGRSLTLANVGRRMAEFNKKAFLIDFDLEAPGLHYKFQKELKDLSPKKGLVDYIHHFFQHNQRPENLEDYYYTIQLPNKETIWLMPAGDPNSSEYWQKLSGFDWKQWFFRDEKLGARLLMDLKGRIEKELNPDYMLVDSRTGITDITALSLKLLADKVVVLAANNDENLDGAAMIMRTLAQYENLEPIFVLSRLPLKEQKIEDTRLEHVRKYLSKRGVAYIQYQPLVLHSDRELEWKEEFRLGVHGFENHTLTKDYLQLFDVVTEGTLKATDKSNLDKKQRAAQLLTQVWNEQVPQKALEYANEALKLDKHNPEVFYAKTYVNHLLERFREALDDATHSIFLDPHTPIGYNNRAIILYKLNRYEESISDCTKAINIDPGYKEAYLNRGNTYAELKKYNRALSDYNKAIELNPNYADAFFNRGNVLSELKKYHKAITDYSKAIELDPNYSNAYTNRAKMYHVLNNYEEAQHDFDKAIQLNTNFANPYITRSYFYFKHEEYNKAFSDINKAIELESDNAQIHLRRGYYYMGIHDYENALSDLNKALELNPYYAMAYNNRAHVYRYIKNYKQAIQDALKAIELEIDDGIAYATLAEIYAEQDEIEGFYHNIEKALELGFSLDKAIEKDPVYQKFINQPRFQQLLEKYQPQKNDDSS